MDTYMASIRDMPWPGRLRTLNTFVSSYTAIGSSVASVLMPRHRAPRARCETALGAEEFSSCWASPLVRPFWVAARSRSTAKGRARRARHPVRRLWSASARAESACCRHKAGRGKKVDARRRGNEWWFGRACMYTNMVSRGGRWRARRRSAVGPVAGRCGILHLVELDLASQQIEPRSQSAPVS
jgi:hypothetical protein